MCVGSGDAQFPRMGSHVLGTNEIDHELLTPWTRSVLRIAGFTLGCIRPNLPPTAYP